jgi:EmrB/QacA subfamily drug resistance transporter
VIKTGSSSPRRVLVVTTISAFAASFANSSVNVALPAIGSEFHLGGVALNWVVTAFVLASSILVMPMGRLGDLFGRQRVFLIGLVVYASGGLFSALAPNEILLLAARILCGSGAAMVLGTSTAILVSAYPPAERGKVLGINVGMVYFGLSVGPPLGGVIVQTLGWRSLFVIQALLGVLVIVQLVLWLKGNEKVHREGGFDLAGSALFALGLALLLIGLSDLPQVMGIALAAAGTVVLGVFWVYESRVANPVLPVTLFTKNRTFAFSNLAATISYSATFAVAFFLSLYLEVVRGLPPSVAGLVLVVQPLVQAAFSPLTGRMSDKVSPGLLASSGMALTAVGLGALAFLDATTPLPLAIGALVLLGMGFALFSSPNTNAIMGSVEKRDLGVASATVSTMRGIGMMLSMGLTLVLLSLILGKSAVSPETADQFLLALRWGFSISAVLCALGILASLARGPAQKA